ncbi:MAG: di-trans,poly-cis-decaprenylcistransferase [Euryarchaeota archaeon RBG_19FT_COMBO_56_21]|nr:MAG: di-trans,poly-cis-decaprenylcistransferase [Euryarchaeota archaeon RBG_19FT_COMBO_56_21]
MASDLSKAISSTAYSTYEKRLLKEVMSRPVPHHVAIIMDGNRRYASEFGMVISQGHEKGREKLEQILEWCMEIGVKMLTVYAFSTENINREKAEVDDLMRMFTENFRRLSEDDRVHKHKIRVSVLGQKELLPKDVQQAIALAEEKTKGYDQYFFNLAVAYGGREEIVQAIRRIADEVKKGKLSVEDITEKTFTGYLYTKDMPDPDLILRTSGEERISNFLLWQLAYSELYFSDVYWPGFRKIDFLRAVRAYQLRKRRYGT